MGQLEAQNETELQGYSHLNCYTTPFFTTHSGRATLYREKNLMKRKRYWGLVALIIIGLGIGTFFLFYKPDTDPTIIYKGDTKSTQKIVDTEGVEKDNSSVPDEVSGDAITEGTKSNPNIAKSKTDTKYATEVEGYEKEGVEGMYVTHIPRDPDRFAHLPPPPLPPSAVPEDIPEHLKLPPEWIDGVYRNIEPDPPDDQLTPEIARQLHDIIQEIVREHNPNRPYAEIWDQFIEYEKMYIKYAEYELGYTPSSGVPGANRVDWMYEQTWAFPELIALGIPGSPSPPHGEEHPFIAAREVAIGYLNPDWNKFTLKDGRDFFIKGKTRYEFVYSGVTESGDEWENVSGFARCRVTDSTPVVRIDVMNTSDADLQALMGWDYRINPLTLEPLRHDGYYDPIYPRIATGEVDP